MANALYGGFTSLLIIFSIWSLGIVAQSRALSVDRRKGGWEWGKSLRKIGLTVSAISIALGFAMAAIGSTEKVIQFTVAAAVAGANVYIIGVILLANNRLKLADEMRTWALRMALIALVCLIGTVATYVWASLCPSP